MSKLSFKATALALAALLVVDLVAAQTAPAAAPKAPEPDLTITYNLGAVSDYRFRGISQTSKGSAIQGGLDLAHKSGLYAGAWGSNVRWVRAFNGASKSNAELDLYAGYKGEATKGLTYDLGFISYDYPGNNSGAAGTLGAGSVSNANTKEIYAALTYDIYTLKYSRSLGDFLGFIDSKGSNYADLSAAFDLGNGITLTPHLGHQKVVNSSGYDYSDFSLTLAKDLGKGFTLSAAVTATNANKTNYTEYAQFGGKAIAGSGFVLGAKYSF